MESCGGGDGGGEVVVVMVMMILIVKQKNIFPTNLSAVWGRDQAMMVSVCLSSASQASNFLFVEVAQLHTPLNNSTVNVLQNRQSFHK